MSDTSTSKAPSSSHFQSPARVIVCALLTLIGIGMSAWAYQFNGPHGPILTWGVLPGAPFVMLAGLSLVTRIPLRVTIGAYLGGVLAVAVPYGAIWYSSLNYNGGGANIGLGILLIETLVLLPIPILIGGFAGWLCGHAINRRGGMVNGLLRSAAGWHCQRGYERCATGRASGNWGWAGQPHGGRKSHFGKTLFLLPVFVFGGVAWSTDI